MSDFECQVGEGLVVVVGGRGGPLFGDVRTVEEKRTAWRKACKNLGFYGEYEGKRYCILHFPGEKNRKEFEQVKQSMLERNDYNFGATVFPKGTSDFEEVIFDGNTDFEGATFTGVACFLRAEFRGERTYFQDVKFSSTAIFRQAEFSGEYVSFNHAKFSRRANFYLAEFSGEAWFQHAGFSGGASFSEAKFSGGTSFYETWFDGRYQISFFATKFGGVSTFFFATRFNAKDMNVPKWYIGFATIDFSEAQFRSSHTIFSGATFTAKTTFSEALFGSPTEETTITFTHTKFLGDVNFSDAHFHETVDFLSVSFGGEVDFSSATFDKSVKLRGGAPVVAESDLQQGTILPESRIRLNGIRIGAPDASLLQSVFLRPSWLVNIVDVRELKLINVSCRGVTVRTELEALARTDAPHELLARTCRELAANAEESRDYPLANDFYYWSMEALRKEGYRRLGLIRTMYWALSGYGVKPGHAFVVLLAIWVVFAAFYVLVPSSEFYAFSPSNAGQVISGVGQAIVYSMATMARLNPEPKPDPGLFQFLVTIEGILGPLQIALLALAIRRKVMR